MGSKQRRLASTGDGVPFPALATNGATGSGAQGRQVIENVAKCPMCGGAIRVSILANEKVLYVCKRGGGHDGFLLPSLAQALKTRQYKLLSPSWVRQAWRDRPAVRAAATARPLPSSGSIAGWSARLHLASEPDPFDWLTDVRGLSPGVIRDAQIGWDGRRLTFPMFSDGVLAGFKTRALGPGGQMRSWPGSGRSWPLYPEPNTTAAWVLVVAGEMDALRARSAGLPAVSVTCGASTWLTEWTSVIGRRNVVVCFDNNEQDLALRRAHALAAAGLRVKRLDLRILGLRRPKGDLSDYLNDGGDRRSVLRAIRRLPEVTE
jgi:hypothetical protein